MLSGSQPTYRQYRAPRRDNQALVEPPLGDLQIAPPCPGISLTFGEQSLSELRAAARTELLEAAQAYTASYRDLPTLPAAGARLYLTGHQAELFHPGVWFKNFMLSRLAAEHAAVGIHLVIDTDILHSASVRVPTGSVTEPRVDAVPFDAVAPPLPVEERQVVDEQLLKRFDRRVVETIAPLVDQPLVREWWPSVVAAIGRNQGNLGLALAQARHQLEAEWGAATLDVPMSHCCRLPVFYRFSAALLADAERVRRAYNESLAAYRQAHRLRSDAQPMPDLAAVDEWIETPFWMWTSDDPRRRPLYVHQAGERITLTDRQAWTTELTASSSAPHAELFEQLQQLAAGGVKIRTRALTTTLFARLVLSDLFLHGIGGAKYDEVTDDLARRLWGCAPPAYQTLSATLHLPIAHESVTAADLQRIDRQLRDGQWNPDRLLEGEVSPEVAQAAADKRQWIATPQTPQNARERHQAIELANRAIHTAVSDRIGELQQQRQQLAERARATAVLESREYAFCLYPADDLRRRMWDLVDQT